MGMGSSFKFLIISRRYLIIFGFLSLSFSLKAQLKIEVEVVAPLVDPNKPLYLALDFEKWNPGDTKYILKKESF